MHTEFCLSTYFTYKNYFIQAYLNKDNKIFIANIYNNEGEPITINFNNFKEENFCKEFLIKITENLCFA